MDKECQLYSPHFTHLRQTIATADAFVLFSFKEKCIFTTTLITQTQLCTHSLRVLWVLSHLHMRRLVIFLCLKFFELAFTLTVKVTGADDASSWWNFHRLKCYIFMPLLYVGRYEALYTWFTEKFYKQFLYTNYSYGGCAVSSSFTF